MKEILFALLFISNFVIAQNPLLKQWDYRYGGGKDDEVASLCETSDGGYIMGGVSYSGISGDKTQAPWGGGDYWLVKTDSSGIKQWDLRYGGTAADGIATVLQTTDKGYILGGGSSSHISGDKTQNGWGINDYWIVKVDSAGTKLWDKDYGSTDGDYFTCLQITNDGGYILGGYSFGGIGGDKTEPNWDPTYPYYPDYWIVKVDSAGTKEWDKDFGADYGEYLTSIQQTTDGGYILGGYSQSGVYGNKTEPSYGYDDYWIVKIDSAGSYQWDKDYGGLNEDYLTSLEKTNDGGYILGGYSYSGISGNKTQPNWDTAYNHPDYWIIKIDSLGNMEWDKDYGGIYSERLGSIIQTYDSGYLLTGSSDSPISGDKTESNFGGDDYWVIRIDQLGNKLWDKTIQTDDGDGGNGLGIQTKDGCYTFASYTAADAAGEKTQPEWFYSWDYWIIKFCDTSSTQASFFTNSNVLCKNSCISFTDFSINNPISWQWTFDGGNPASSSQQNPSNICYSTPGIYDVTLIVSGSFGSDTLVQTGYITILAPPLVTISQNGNLLTCNPAANSYQWYLNSNQIAGDTLQTLLITQTGTYIVDVTDTNGCTAGDTIIVNVIPAPDFSVMDTSLCEKFCTNFLDQSTNNPIAWQWIFDGGSPAASSIQNPTNICYNQPGQYNVTLITTSAFGNDTLLLNNYITVFPTPPLPTITQSGYTLISTPATSYQWQFNSVDIPGATNQLYTVLQSGIYTVVVADSNGCVNSTSQDVLITGIDEITGDGSIHVFPNPSTGNFTLEILNVGSYNDISIDVVNDLGQKIFSSSKSGFMATSEWKKVIEMPDAMPGVYFIEVKSKNIFMRKKIVIAN